MVKLTLLERVLKYLLQLNCLFWAASADDDYLRQWIVSNAFDMKKQFVDAQDSRVTRWLDNFSIFGHLQKGKLPYLVLNICQSRFKILPNTKWTLKNCQRLLKFHQSGENSPNLVTLYQEQQKQQQQFGSLFLLAVSQYLFLLPSITIYVSDSFFLSLIPNISLFMSICIFF